MTCGCDLITESYTEKYRPQIHFSPETGWMNDPNGMVDYDGEYHLFFQFSPIKSIHQPQSIGDTPSARI
jgi:fructan beta-fructosidase